MRCIFILVGVVVGDIVVLFGFVVHVVMVLVPRVCFYCAKMAVLLVCVMRWKISMQTSVTI